MPEFPHAEGRLQFETSPRKGADTARLERVIIYGAQSSRAARISSSTFDRLVPTGSARMGADILKKPCSSGGAVAAAGATLRTGPIAPKTNQAAASPRFLKRNPRLLEQCGQASDRKRSCRSHIQLFTNAQLRQIGILVQAGRANGTPEGARHVPLAPHATARGPGRVESAISRTRAPESRQALAQIELASGAGAKTRPVKSTTRRSSRTTPSRSERLSPERITFKMAALELDHRAVPLDPFPAILLEASARQNLQQNPCPS